MKKILTLITVVLVFALVFTGCAKPAETPEGTPAVIPTETEETTETSDEPVVIGVSMGTLQEERWQKECDMIVRSIEANGGTTKVLSANADDNQQIKDCENLITQGVDLLIVMPNNGDACSPIVDAAHEAGIKVIAYNRMITNSDVDFFLTFDDFQTGVIQAQWMLENAEFGNWIFIGGSPTDPNAALIRNGQLSVLQPYIDSGQIKVVVDQSPANWNPDLALEWIEDGFTKCNDDIQAVLTSNDGCAGAAAQVVAERGLTGKIPITGLDAELSACQRIVEGTQGMTVYKQLNSLATICGEIAVKMAKGIEIKDGDYDGLQYVNNGKSDVYSIKLAGENDIFAITKDNMQEAVVSGWLKKEDIYANIPKDQWPEW